MNMSADLLASLSGSENANDGYSGCISTLRRLGRPVELRIKGSWSGLVVVDAVQSEAEWLWKGRWRVHYDIGN